MLAGKTVGSERKTEQMMKIGNRYRERKSEEGGENEDIWERGRKEGKWNQIRK